MNGKELKKYSSTDSDGSNLPADISYQLKSALQKKQTGRASSFTVDKALDVLDDMTAGFTTEESCKRNNVPVSTWYVWRSVVPGLLEASLQASELQADSQVDQADLMLRSVDLDSIDPKLANAALRKAQQIADFRFNLAKTRNVRYIERKANLNMNVNTTVQDADISSWFNR